MRRVRCAIAIVTLLLVVLGPARAQADPIRVIGGNLNFDDGDPPGFIFQLAGFPFMLSGVTFSAAPGSGLISLPPQSAMGCFFVAPCLPGEVLTLGVSVEGTGLGRMGEDVSSEDPNRSLFLSAAFQFTTPAVPLADGSSNFQVLTAPFEFFGRVQLFSDESRTTEVLDTRLFGGGMATAVLTRESGEGPYLWEESRYNFAPVPEPATFTLLGTGLFAGWLAGKRRRRQAER